ncbi:MAG: hypothetical protein C5B55_10955 [Blastocatellia bacterium]|nr:MAG: hypothetical protein C5B55_10955 [Blastocatellia bacterium]
MRRRIQIWTVQKTRIRPRSFPLRCPICFARESLLAFDEAQIVLNASETVLRCRLAQGNAHGVMTTQGDLLICSASFVAANGLITPDKKETT